MWWEVVTELAYKMALDCGQSQDFFEMVDELSKHNGSHQKVSSQSAMSTLLGHDWRNHRKRGRDPIRRVSHFNGMLDDDQDGDRKERPESVLVKRPQHSPDEPIRDMVSILKSTPVDLTDRQSMSQRSASISPVKTTEVVRPSKPAPKEPTRLSPATAVASQPKAAAIASQTKSSSSLRKIPSQTDSSTSPPLRALTPAKKRLSAGLSDSSRDDPRHSRYDEKLPSKSVSARSGKLGVAEKRQKPKKRRSSTKSTTKEYVVDNLKSVKANDNGELVYLVEWQGDWDDTWEPYHFVAHLEDDIEQVYQKASPEVQAAMRLSGHIEPVD